MNAKYRDHFLTRERILVIVLVAVSVLVGWLCWLMVKPFVPAVTWAVVLAVIAHPLARETAREDAEVAERRRHARARLGDARDRACRRRCWRAKS